MLHRAFSGLGHMGLNCAGVDQSAETTARRARLGECLVAVRNGRLVGTVTLHKPARRAECRWYRRSDVASLHQFAVDPRYQGLGYGEALLAAATRWASERGYVELALHTPALAAHLVEYYQSQGFCVVEQLRFAGKSYRSQVLSKSLAATTQRPRCPPPPRTAWCGVMVQA